MNGYRRPVAHPRDTMTDYRRLAARPPDTLNAYRRLAARRADKKTSLISIEKRNYGKQESDNKLSDAPVDGQPRRRVAADMRPADGLRDGGDISEQAL